MKYYQKFVFSLILILCNALFNYTYAQCNKTFSVDVRDTLDNHVIYRHENVITVYKVGCFQSKKQIKSSFGFQESSNKSAMIQCSSNYNRERMEQLVRTSFISFSNDDAIGRVFLDLVLSKTLNIEYFELSGRQIQALSSDNVLRIYNAINKSLIFSLWSEPVPYVVFGIAFSL